MHVRVAGMPFLSSLSVCIATALLLPFPFLDNNCVLHPERGQMFERSCGENYFGKPKLQFSSIESPDLHMLRQSRCTLLAARLLNFPKSAFSSSFFLMNHSPSLGSTTASLPRSLSSARRRRERREGGFPCQGEGGRKEQERDPFVDLRRLKSICVIGWDRFQGMCA